MAEEKKKWSEMLKAEKDKILKFQEEEQRQRQ